MIDIKCEVCGEVLGQCREDLNVTEARCPRHLGGIVALWKEIEAIKERLKEK